MTMSDSNSDAPNVRIVPPLIYLTGLAVGFLANVWMPIEFIPDLLAWALGGAFIACGALLTGSALLRFRGAGTTVRPDRPATTLVIAGPYRITRNPMYLGLAFAYLGISVAGESVWALILLPVVLIVINRWAIGPEEAFLQRRFGDAYIRYTTKVRRWM
jgi:protein-S-isoprenylcysteine O-methyltransferase Ste14